MKKILSSLLVIGLLLTNISSIHGFEIQANNNVDEVEGNSDTSTSNDLNNEGNTNNQQVNEAQEINDESKNNELDNKKIEEDKKEQETLSKIMNMTYNANVQTIGLQSRVGLNQVAGTTGQGLALKGISINLDNTLQPYGMLLADAHISNVGWQTNKGLNVNLGDNQNYLEGIRLNLTDKLAEKYDIYYQVHVEGAGWLGWAKNGQLAGSEGCQRRIEAFKIAIEPKDNNTITQTTLSYTTSFYNPGLEPLTYRSHVQNIGWQNSVSSPSMSGTTGRSLRMEAFQITGLSKVLAIKGNLSYQTHVQDIGWQNPVNATNIAGTTGQAKRVEGIKINLLGTDLVNDYDVYYRTHVEGIGWLGWAKNGQLAGSTGCSRAIEAIEVRVYPKRSRINLSVGNSYTTVKKPKPQYKPVYYTQHDRRWGGYQYGKYTLSGTGCVPTCLAMAISGIMNTVISPKTVADFLWNNTNQFNKLFVGSSGLAIKLAADHFGLKHYPISNLAELNSQLSQGRIVIGLQAANSSFVDYAPSPEWTHAIVLYGYRQGGYCNVYDPNKSSRNGVYATGTLWTQRSHQSIDKNYKGIVFHALYK